MVRNVGYEQCRPRASVATSIYVSNSQVRTVDLFSVWFLINNPPHWDTGEYLISCVNHKYYLSLDLRLRWSQAWSDDNTSWWKIFECSSPDDQLKQQRFKVFFAFNFNWKDLLLFCWQLHSFEFSGEK